MVSLNEHIAGVWELHPVVERSTLRRSVVNFQGTSFDSADSLRPPLSAVALTGTKREDCGARLMATTSSRSRKGDASCCRRIFRSSQPPRRNAFAVRPMNLQRKFEPFVQRRRRRAFDSASKERRVDTRRCAIGFAFAELVKALKC